MMRLLLLLLLFSTCAELVITQDKTRLILKDGRHTCEGHVQIYHGGKWGYVGDKFWSPSTEKVVCRSAQCGEPVANSTEDVQRPQDSVVLLNEVRCSGEEEWLWECEHHGWSTSYYPKDTVKKITCSNTIGMKLDGFDCAGAVQFSNNGTKPSGYICKENWGKKESDFLCENLGCGKSKEIPTQEWMIWNDFRESDKVTINCLDLKTVETDLWQCLSEMKSKCSTPASVICQGHKRLQLTKNTSSVCSGQLEIEESGKWKPATNLTDLADKWCQQMFCGTKLRQTPIGNGIQLECSEQINVVLMDKNQRSSCYGSVHIDINNSAHPVCASTWSRQEAELVCKELGCGKLIHTSTVSGVNGIMDYVNCSANESSLWHCRAKRDRKRFPCTLAAHVVCEGSVNVALVDGPGKCAGRVQVLHEGEWRRVSDKEWTGENSNTVCKQLGCGQSGKVTKTFSKGSGSFLAKAVKCTADAANVSECIAESSSNKPIRNEEAEPVGITCTEHRMLFLEGETPCSGRVGIEHDTNVYWLSGSNDTWTNDTANVVCRQKHCGHAVSVDAVQTVNQTLVTASPCPPHATSLFDCLKSGTTSPGPNGTVASVATVTCSGEIHINLTDGCWGAVTIYMGGEHGGVCADSWTDEQSQLLCKNLGCGERTLKTSSRPKAPMLFKSLHSTKQTKKLSQSSFIKCGQNEEACDSNPAHVVCSGSVQPSLTGSRDQCVGNVQLSYEGQGLTVCKENLTVETHNIICNQLDCGNAVQTLDYFGERPKTFPDVLMLDCPKNNKASLKECSMSRSRNPGCSPVGLQCSKWKKMKVSDVCRGDVFVDSKGKRSPVSSEGWNQTEGQRLCKNLGCGNSGLKISSKVPKTPLWNRSFTCAGVTSDNIWDCERKTGPTQTQQLVIECADVPVKLSQTCGGVVKVDNVEVCSTGWTNDYSHLVCQELNCSNAVISTEYSQMPDANKKYYHVRCEFGQHKLGQCERVLGRCADRLVSVSCVEKVQFNTTSKCGGEIQVKYRSGWEKVCVDKLSVSSKNDLCKRLGCRAHNSSEPDKKSGAAANLKTTLDCGQDSMDVRFCVRAKDCGRVKPAEIYCSGYKPPPTPPPPSNPPILAIILGIGFFLVLVILIVIVVRVFLARRAKKAMKLPARILSHKDVEIESGDYEDVRASEMEEFSRGRFGSEVDAFMDADGRSASSFHYDDVDEAVDTQPLTSPASADAVEQNQATYEVDDPHDSYDDIEAVGDVAQTEAEVHGGQQPGPDDGDCLPPPDLVQGDDDYLVPDHPQ